MKPVQPHDPITVTDLQTLASVDQDLCVSLYMPTHPAAPESHQDPVRLRNLVDEAENRLSQQGHKPSEIKKLLEPARDMVADEYFWTHQSEGLAIFLTQDSIRRFRLPAPFEQCTEVARQFLITPLISLLRPGHAFFILAVSQNSCRLLRGTQFQVEEVEHEDLPKDLQSALGWWREREISFHSQPPRGPGDFAIIHGHDVDDKEIDLTAYLRQVAEPLKPMLHNQKTPLLFAGVEELFPIFRRVYGEKGLINERIAGNPDQMSDVQLHQKAWPVVEHHNQEQAAQIWDDYYGAQNLERASHDLQTILTACRDGLVETLLIADGTRHLVTIDPETHAIEPENDEGHLVDALNLAAVMALRTDAKVMSVPPSSIPDKASAAAILRGPVSAVQT